LQMAAGMTDRVKQTIGQFNPVEIPNDESGRARALRQRREDSGTFAFTDNLSRAMRRLGLLLIEAIPKVYDTERVMRLRGEDGQSDWVKVNQVVQGEDGKEVVVNALGQGEFDVAVKTGPSFSTQRQEAAEGQMRLMEIAPNTIALAGDVMVENMDWPQADKIARRMRMALPPNLLTPQEKEEMAEGQGGPQMGPDGQPMPTPEERQAAMQEQAMQLQAKLAEAEVAAKMASAEAEMATARATEAKADATIMQAKADMLEAAVRMQSAQRGGMVDQRNTEAAMRAAERGEMVGEHKAKEAMKPKPAPAMPNGGTSERK
jgi:hypothetical protein